MPVCFLRRFSVSGAGRPSAGPAGVYSGTISGCAWGTRSKNTLSAYDGGATCRGCAGGMRGFPSGSSAARRCRAGDRPHEGAKRAAVGGGRSLLRGGRRAGRCAMGGSAWRSRSL